MKMEEYQKWMTELSEASGVSREILDHTSVLVIHALRIALKDRDDARKERDVLKDPTREALIAELARVDNECRTLGCKRKSAWPAKEEIPSA